MEPGELLAFTFETFGKRAAIGTSLQKTGSVMIDLAAKTGVEFSVFFVDTLFNYDETMELYDEIQSHYGIAIERLVPNPDDIEELYEHYGQFPFFSGVHSNGMVQAVLDIDSLVLNDFDEHDVKYLTVICEHLAKCY